MNYQTKPGDLPTLSAEEASKILTEKIDAPCMPSDLEYSCWVETFASTSGPFGGIGGQAMSRFTIEAWDFLGDAVVFCRGRVLGVGRFAIQVESPSRRRR
jgi:hypothetical protein